MYVVLIVIRGQKVKELVSSKSVISQHSCPYISSWNTMKNFL